MPDFKLRLPVELTECITSILNANSDVMPTPHLALFRADVQIYGIRFLIIGS